MVREPTIPAVLIPDVGWYWFVVVTWTALSGIGLLAALRLTEMSVRLQRQSVRDNSGADIAIAFLFVGAALTLMFTGLFWAGVSSMRHPEPVSIVVGVVSLVLAGLLSAATFYLMKVVGRRFG